MATLPPRHSNLSESWRDLYVAAILELDKAKLLPRITQAENAISERSSELFDEDGVNAEEKQALESALYFFASPSKHVKTRNVGLSLSGERRRAEGCMNCFASVP